MMLKKGLVEVEGLPGFYSIPGKPDFSIAKDGRLFSHRSNQFLSWTTSVAWKSRKGGYKVNRQGSRHRLLATTFLELPEGYENSNSLVVNHKNGIPGDDRLSNLEWCTYSHNTQHAYDNGLHPNKVRAVLVKDFVSDKITRYPSIVSAADDMGWGHAKTRSRLARQPGARYEDYAIKLDDGKPWPKLFLRENDIFIPAITKNVITGEKCVHESVSHAARFIGISQTGALKAAKKKHVKPLNFFLIRFLSSKIVWPEFSDRDLEIIKASPENPVCGISLRDVIDDKEIFFPCKKGAMDYLDINANKLENDIKRQRLVKNRYLLSKVYLSTNKRYNAPLSGNGH